jgi:hypothetical protein
VLAMQQWLRRKDAVSFRRLTRLACAIFFLTASVYLVTASLFTYETPTTHEVWAKGFICTSDARLIFKERCPELGLDELRTAEYQAERLWTGQSVVTIKLLLLTSWIMMFWMLGTLVAAQLKYE